MTGIMSKKTKTSIPFAVNPRTKYIVKQDPPPVPIHHKPNVQPTTMVMDSEQEDKQSGQAGRQLSWAKRMLGWWR